MQALKIMLADSTIIAYRMKRPIVAAQMVKMTEEEFAAYPQDNRPPLETIFSNLEPANEAGT